LGDWEKRNHWNVSVHKEGQNECFDYLSSAAVGLKFQKNRWYHVAVVRAEDSICLYVDGVRVDRMVSSLKKTDNLARRKVSKQFLQYLLAHQCHLLVTPLPGP
jgi:hypothetical protein